MYNVGELPFIEKVTTNRQLFGEKLIQIADKLDILPHYLMIVMNNESGLNPAAKNPNSSATGLIQFMDSTAKSLGTTTQALRQMSNVEQLDYVYKYFKPYAGKMNDVTDVYLAVFYPYAIKQNEDYVFPALVTKSNKIFDLNHDTVLTKSEFRKYVNEKYNKYIPLRALADFKKKDNSINS